MLPQKKNTTKRSSTRKQLIKITSESKNFRNAAGVGNELMTFNAPTYTDQELEYFEQAWSTTPAGTALDKRQEIAYSKGWKPRFELIDPTKADGSEMSEEEKGDILKTYDDIIKELEEIDELVKAKERFMEGATMAKVFGRCVVAFESGTEDKSVGMPKALKVIHPRNTNKVTIDQSTWELESVKTMNPSANLTPDEMVYMVNKPNSPIRQTLLFGYSEMQRVAGASRAYRRIIEFDMPEIAHTMWAGYGMFLLKKLGRSGAQQTTDANDIFGSLNAGSFNVVTVDAMDEIEFQQLDLDPKIKELVDLADFYERIMIGNAQTPAALLGREEDQNRATLIGKMRFFKEGPVKGDQEWLSDLLSEQWYERNIKKLGKGDILEHVRVTVEFENMPIEAWDDMVEAAETLKRVMPGVPYETLIEILNLEQHKDKIIEGSKNLPDAVKLLPIPKSGLPTQEPLDLDDKGTAGFMFNEAATLSWRKALREHHADTNIQPIGDPNTTEQPRELDFQAPSTVVGEVIYTPDDQTMTIELNGNTYNYCSVPQAIFTSFKGASSKGAYYNRSVKGQFDCA